MALNSTETIRSTWNYTDSVADLRPATSKDTIKHEVALTNGSGSGQANVHFHDRRILTPGTATDDLDLAGGLTDPLGRTLTFTAVKKLLIINRGKPNQQASALIDATFTETDGEDLLVGGAGAGGNAIGTPFNGDQDAKVVVNSGDELSLTNKTSGFAVTGGTGDILRIVNNGADDIVYDIVIEGVGTAV